MNGNLHDYSRDEGRHHIGSIMVSFTVLGCQRLSCNSTVISLYQLLIVDVLQIRKVG